MVQPFVEFEKKYIPRLRELKKIYLVTQTYHRAANLFLEDKTALLVSSYDDPGLAEIHLKAVIEDKFAAIINLCDRNHFDKLMSMLEPGSAYQVYWSVVKDAARLERQLTSKFADNMRRYIERNTSWTIGGNERIRPGFEVSFGELFVSLKWGSQRQRVKFEEIEKS
jgi:hypothetical protein